MSYTAPVDDPSRHQGRTRAIPYVEGQFVGHVYVPIKLEGALLSMLREVVQSAQATDPGWRSSLDLEDAPATASKVSMHLSLSRPVPLRAHQRDGLRKEVRKAAAQNKQFTASFSQLAILTNDEKTRTFLCAEVGAGHQQFQDLSSSLSSYIASLRQLPYYSQPRFHISIAWILTPPTLPTLTDSGDGQESSATDEFLRRTATSVGELQQKFSDRLLELGRIDAHSVEVRIGKETHKWPLVSSP
ncbi:eukaryotic translation initiation factor 3 subunit A [Ceratobasidium sp. AG-Ba]|nr:eukaryotic translation initiation factor 3 subunit A [Ceratobasidium sp. AG-Ba]QRW06643.1 eukaryotic translation initiation factor 3 subunit A [Ceratobasidium sp. AG-Ba]